MVICDIGLACAHIRKKIKPEQRGLGINSLDISLPHHHDPEFREITHRQKNWEKLNLRILSSSRFSNIAFGVCPIRGKTKTRHAHLIFGRQNNHLKHMRPQLDFFRLASTEAGPPRNNTARTTLNTNCNKVLILNVVRLFSLLSSLFAFGAQLIFDSAN